MNFSKKIIQWYGVNKRELPWRETIDPYKIWLSEIILQQTRIEQGTDYYLRFITQYPDIETLANASEEEILKLWQGLGYYSRARNLHKTAKTISQDYNGIFPNTYEELIKQKGIGEYTAAAIASIAFGIPRPVVDGNVLRFLSRLFGNTKPINTPAGKNTIKNLAEKLIVQDNPGEFNQAVMEFGALHCKPQNPDCTSCIFKKECVAFKEGIVKTLPAKTKSIKQQTRYFNYLVFKQKRKNETFLILNHRTEKDIWQNMYDFPLIETTSKHSKIKLTKVIREEFGLLNDLTIVFRSSEYRHILTHRILYAYFYVINLPEDSPFFDQLGLIHNTYKTVNLNDINKFPIPRLIDKFLSKNLNLLRE